MADRTITAEQLGAYEVPLVANTPVTIETDGKDFFNVLAHEGASPVYAKFADTLQAKDPTSVIIPQGSFATVRGTGKTLAVVSASSGSFSVVRASA